MAGRRGRSSTSGRTSANAGRRRAACTKSPPASTTRTNMSPRRSTIRSTRPADRHAGRRSSRHPVGAVRRRRDTARHPHGQRSARRADRAAHGAPARRRRHQPLRPDGWNCTDLPPAEGETRGRRRVHQAALRKDDAGAGPDGRDAFPAQARPTDIDPETHEYTSGQFESWTRFELFDPNYRKP